MAQPHTGRKRNRGVSRISSAGVVLHWLGMIAMVVGLFAPLVTTESASASVMTPERAMMMAAQQPFDRDTATFDRVVLVGDFQQQLGCSAWDTNCDLTTLQNSNGFWTGVFNVPPGAYSWELVAFDQNGTQYSVDSNQVSLSEDQLGIYAEFNSVSRDSSVSPVSSVATANGPFGNVALAQEGEGFVASAINVDTEGWVDLQVQVNGETTATGANFSQGANRVSFDALGNITNVQPLGYAELTVQRVDADGNPLPGSCFVANGSSQSRGCDADDGSNDGSTTLRFPAGVQPGAFTLSETSPAEGQEAAEDQQIDVQSGSATVQVQSAAPELELGDVIVLRQDQDGNAIGGACFELVDDSGATVGGACDEDGDVADDGRIGIMGVPAGTYTVRESRTPEGYDPAEDASVSVSPNDTTEVTVQSGSTAPVAGDLVVLRQDQDGNAVGGACFEIIDANGQSVGSACDEDGDVPDDGRIGLIGVPSGDYTLRETRTPDGYEPAGDVNVTVLPDQVTEQPVQSTALATEEPTEEPTEVPTEEPTITPTEEPEVGRVIVYRTDDAGVPVGGSCFEVVDANGQSAGSACDEDGIAADDGTTGIENVPVGDYTLRETRTPEGYEQAPDTPVTTQIGDTEINVSAPAITQPTEEPTQEPTATPTEEPTEVPTEEPTVAPTEEPTITPTEEPEVGRVVVYRTDDAGFPVGGSCFEVVDANGQSVSDACDEDGLAADDGTTGIENVPVGDYTLRETRTPEGYEQAPDTPVTTQAGDTVVTVAAPVSEPPTEEPTQEPTATPTEEPTEVPTEEPTVAPTEEPTITPTEESEVGRLIVYRTDDAGIPVGGSCFEVVDANGQSVSDACDEDGLAADDGTTGIENIPVGDYTLRETRTPEGYEQAPDTPVTTQVGDTEVSVAAPVVEQPTEEPTDVPTEEPTEVPTEEPTVVPTEEVPETGNLIVQRTDENGDPVGGSCVAVVDENQNVIDEKCDEEVTSLPEGSVDFPNLPAGDMTVRETRTPDGMNPAEDESVSVEPNTETQVTLTSEAIEPSPGTGATLVVTYPHVDGEVMACIELDTAGSIGMLELPFACDAGQNDMDDAPGVIRMEGLDEGTFVVDVYEGPDDLVQAEPREVTLVAGETTTLTYEALAPAPTSFTVLTTDGANPVPGACYTLDDDEALCDEGEGVTFDDVAPGEHTVTMTGAPDGYNLADPASQTVTVTADGQNTATFAVTPVTKDIVVTTVDGQSGLTLPGACYILDDGEPVCDTQETGQVVFSDVAPIDHQLSMETAPEGFEPAADQVVPADATSVEVPLQAETGSIQVSITDDGGNPLPGACVSLDSSDEICDVDDGTNDGSILFENLTVGEHSITITQAPDGYDLPEETTQTVTVEQDTAAPVTFQLAETPPAPGGLDVAVEYSDETEVTEACVTVTHSNGEVQQSACDGDANDQNDAAGVVGFNDLPAGTYSVTLSEGYEPSRPVVPGALVSADVPEGDRGEVLLTLELLPETGSLEIVTSSDGTNVGGACFTVDGIPVCDNEDLDADGTDGVVLITGLEPGEYQVEMSTVPAGYQQPAAQQAPITAGEETSIEFELVRQAVPGTITVRTLDGDNNPLNNACYAIVQSGTTIDTQCDTDPVDGEVVFQNVPAGSYQVVQTQKPGNQYQDAQPQAVEVGEGENVELDFVMELRTGQLTVRTVDSADQSVALQNACYVVVGNSEFGPFCDADDGNVNGEVRFTNLPAGEYTLRQTVATAGYETAADRTVTINPGGTRVVTVQNDKVQPPAESGTLVVIPLDPNGEPVAGGCYQLFDGDTPVSQRVCDNADDQPARVTITDLPVGELTLREALAPSPDWQISDDISVTIRDGETTTVEVPHEYKSGNVVIQAVNSVGLPLQGACFMLTDAGDTEPCTDESGQATVSGLAPGTRELTQTTAPFGYKLDTTPREVIVRPGQTTTVRVVFQNEPPPNTGTVQVQKFYCPAGEEGERTVFLGGAQGNQQLKQTAGCEPGVANFTLEAEDGSTESNATFKTNEDGRAQLTAVNGIYLLTETDPDMPGNSAARIRVGTGQMTTVIVINYVAPPEPAPVTIDVEGYTCPPGFNGSSFVDFQNSCMANSQLTNGITVRAESANRYKHVTGDTGELGKTTFSDLPAGTYTILAERPHAIPVTYLFCGTDANNPNLKAVNGSVQTTQESGSTILCRVFQIPPLFDANNGAIQVQKYNCPIDERQRGYDYKNECSRASEPIPFEIQQVDPKTRDAIGQPVRVSTNGDGIVQFPMLVPGTYRLTEVDGEWCFAQSNSVDANGDVIVAKNKLSEVWVYNCVGTKSPPNTGSGDAAETINPDSGIGPMQVLPNLIWPTVLLVGWMVWRDRRQA